ncbi:hypothetical protein [Segetibacter koreensis]|uniref:hypothetical protein n=1 Tax=Segetibacter koreensis TaxID=398037 RepID=UPI000365F039|nr:hypothetical protein [Segetibacter koreensis]
MNIWVYEAVDKGFAGVELENPSDSNKYGLEKKEIRLENPREILQVHPKLCSRQKLCCLPH